MTYAGSKISNAPSNYFTLLFLCHTWPWKSLSLNQCRFTSFQLDLCCLSATCEKHAVVRLHSTVKAQLGPYNVRLFFSPSLLSVVHSGRKIGAREMLSFQQVNRLWNFTSGCKCVVTLSCLYVLNYSNQNLGSTRSQIISSFFYSLLLHCQCWTQCLIHKNCSVNVG